LSLVFTPPLVLFLVVVTAHLQACVRSVVHAGQTLVHDQRRAK
jgi:hypothetical protein